LTTIKTDTSSRLALFNNVQFIYELNLAELELFSFGLPFHKSSDMREFRLLNSRESILDILKQRTAYFEIVDEDESDYAIISRKNRTRSVNQYLTHWIYPYKGKFHPQMIRALLNIIGLRPGDTLFEPFCGSGTAVLEALLLGINSVAIDVSPLCVLQTRVKSESYKVIERIVKYKERLIIESRNDLFSNSHKYVDLIEKSVELKDVAEFFLLSRMLSISDHTRRGRDYQIALAKNIQSMIMSVQDLAELKAELGLIFGSTDTHIGDARSTGYPDNSFDGIITSPPYSIALDYVANDAHAISALGYDTEIVRDAYIGVRGNGSNRVEMYNSDMSEVFSEMRRVLKPGKRAVIIIGNATFQGREIDSVGFTIAGMQNVGFMLEHNINKIIFGLYNVMKQENILIFNKPI